MTAQATHHYPVPIELTATDVADVADLNARCSDYFLLQDGELPTLDYARDLFVDVPPAKQTSDQTIFGWRTPLGLGAVAAILRDYPNDDIWYLGFLIVDTATRGRGVGRAFYLAIEAWAETRGAREVRLAVLEANGAGERFWRSLGFEGTRRVGPDHFKTRAHRRIELRRSLSGISGMP